MLSLYGWCRPRGWLSRMVFRLTTSPVAAAIRHDKSASRVMQPALAGYLLLGTPLRSRILLLSAFSYSNMPQSPSGSRHFAALILFVPAGSAGSVRLFVVVDDEHIRSVTSRKQKYVQRVIFFSGTART